ncbi:hypothetical protein JR064_21595 [Xanthomonas sp. CFBP 8703]|uniref:Uncharacterized protein n=1 Tax=Xanthomonas bonasiae TaxID=2810351 RepID=A0ABS3B921_9XANT|nr:hypothetical protein [Xanthomonas bonasiae]MBN6104762.1 hypothetical protein [Xanthomonas bonasiae]
MSNDEKMQEVVEVLHGINITDDAIELFVTSTGYTKKEDFQIDVNTGFTGQSPVAITVLRIRPDFGKMRRNVVRICFTKAELGIEGWFEVALVNKIGNSFLNV